jgi:hypothetical protein
MFKGAVPLTTSQTGYIPHQTLPSGQPARFITDHTPDNFSATPATGDKLPFWRWTRGARTVHQVIRC